MKNLLMTVAGLLMLATSALSEDAAKGPIAIAGAVVQVMAPGTRIGAGDLTIRNAGNDTDILLGGTSDRARAVQVQAMTMDNGVMVMRQMPEGLPVKAGRTIELGPDGNRLAFLGVDRPFKPGETIHATLRFRNAGTVDVEFGVGPAVAPMVMAPADGPMKMEGGVMTGEHANHAGHTQ